MTSFAIACLFLATASSAALARADDWMEAIDAGRSPTAAQVDAELRTMDLPQIPSAVGELTSRLEAESEAVRSSARLTLDHVRHFPERDLQSLSTEAVRSDKDVLVERSLRSLVVLEHAGRAASLVTVSAWAERADQAGVAGRLRGPLTSAVLAVLQRDPDSTSWYVSAYDKIPNTLVSTWIDVLRKRSSPDDFLLAYELLGRRKKHDFLILNRMNVLRRSLAENLDKVRLLGLRRYLSDMDARSRAEAARLLASVGDHQAIPMLVPLVGDSEAPVRRAAHVSLKELTGLRFGPSPGRWQSWYAREARWWESEGQDLVRNLEALELPQLLDALNRATQHALYRRELGPVIARLLSHRNEAVVLMALSALESIHAQDQASKVRKLILDRRTSVAAQARAVLAALGGGGAPRAPQR
ncbi:MAG: HEAT repeat domain-containing protein [Planctomycetota bacterium]